MPGSYKINAIAASAAVLGLVAVFADWFQLKANRLVSGDGLSYWQSLGTPLGILLIGLWLTVLAVALLPRYRLPNLGLGILPIVILFAMLLGSGAAAGRILATAPELARVAPSGGFWLSALAVYVLFYAATRQGVPFRTLISISGIAIVIAAIAFGLLDNLSWMVEYEAQRTRFAEELGRHIAIFGTSLAAAVIIGLPLGVWAATGNFARPVLYTLGVIQTVPSLALFGLLLVALAAVRDALPGLGISAIGFLPAVIAITLYSLLPVAQHTHSGIKGVPSDVKDTGAGLGMNYRQLFLRVELPLAAPAIIAGIRIAAIQAVGGTAVAALIGAGGLGFFIFQGLGQAAADLIMLGALSVVALALVVNGIFQFLEERVRSFDGRTAV
jgi:osmoprotectant transport system permease protein